MLDLSTIAVNLEKRADGVWYAREQNPIDYPEEGNSFCYQVEEASFWFNHRNAFIQEALRRYPPTGTFFDIGGGNGFVALSIRDLGIETVLLEPGIEGIRNAQRRGINQLVCATLENAGFIDESLPAVGMFDVLEHIKDDEVFLHKLHQLLIPNGRMYLTVPAYQFLWSTEDEFARHYRRYTLGTLKQRLVASGFRIEYATYIFATLPIPIFLSRTLPSKFGRRKNGDLSKIEAELNPGSKSANQLLNTVLRLELKALQFFNGLPCGGSCLVAARKI